jgi:hypothetical protein
MDSLETVYRDFLEAQVKLIHASVGVSGAFIRLLDLKAPLRHPPVALRATLTATLTE